MKILFILNSSGFGGANISLLTLMRYLKENSVEMYALLPENGAAEEKLAEYVNEYKVIGYRRCDMPPGYVGIPWAVNILKMPYILSVAKSWNVDVIHTNSSSHDIGFIISRILRKPHVWHIRETLEDHYHSHYCFPEIHKKQMERTECVICISDFIYDINSRKYSPRNMKRVYNPFIIDNYFQHRNGFAAGKDSLQILVAGNITDSKGQKEALEALHILKNRGGIKIQLVIIGHGDKTVINELKQYIADNGLENDCKLLPFARDLQLLRSQSDISLNCSYNEGLSRVTVEGMLGGMLAIGNDSGALTEIIGRHNERGLLYRHGDALDLADKIAYAMDNREECFQILMRGQDYAADTFDYRNNCKDIMEIYSRLLSRSAAR